MGHHFYTINVAEGDRAEAQGQFHLEGPAAFVYPDQQPNTVPLLRLFNGSPGDGGDHFYTTDPAEASHAEKFGWRREMDACFVFDPTNPQPAGTVPLLRFYRGCINE